jgi:hypothetical protein
LFEISVDSKTAVWLHMCIFLKLVAVSRAKLYTFGSNMTQTVMDEEEGIQGE